MEGKGIELANKKRKYSKAEIREQLIEAKRQLEEETIKRIKAERSRDEETRERIIIQSRYTFMNNLVYIKSRDELMNEIKLAEFDNLLPSGGNISGSGTGSFIKDTESKTTSVAGGIQISKFCRKQVSGTEDEMHVKLIDISKEELLKPLRDICTNKELDFDTIVHEEISIINKIRAAIDWHTLNNKTSMSEEVVQSLFMLYADGLLKNLSRNKFSVEKITGFRLQANICVQSKNNKKFFAELHGKSDASIMFNENSCETLKQKLLHHRSITIEMKYLKLNGSPTQVASCTSQILAQVLAISKMRDSSEKTVVRAILSNFSKVRLAVGIKEKDSAISYYISTLSSDPVYLLGGIVLMQSRGLENIICKPENIKEDDFDYGEEENANDEEEEEQGEQDDNENIPRGMSLGANFSALDFSPPTQPQTDGGGKSKSRVPLKAINKSNSISMGDDMWEELRESRAAWLDEWDRNRQGPTYLCAKNLDKRIC